MDLSLQSRNLSLTSNSTSKCNMAQDETECDPHRIPQLHLPIPNFAVVNASLHSDVSNAISDAEHIQHQQHQQFGQNHRGTITMPTPASHCLERGTDATASSASEDNSTNCTTLNAKETVRLKSPTAELTNTLQNGNSNNCHDGIKSAPLSVYSHEAENLIGATHIKHANHYGGVNDMKVKSIVNTVELNSTGEHPSNSPHHYHHHFVRQQGRYALATPSQNLSVSTNLTQKQHSTHLQSHRPSRSSIPTVELLPNQMRDHARLVSRQIELHERNELGIQQREQNKTSHYFPQPLYQHINTEKKIKKCLPLPIQHDAVPSSLSITNNHDNDQYQLNPKAYVNSIPPSSPSVLDVYKFPSKLDPLLPLNVLTGDALESLQSNEEVVDLMKLPRKDKRIKKQFLEKCVCLSPKDDNNQQNKLELQEGKNTLEKKMEVNSPIYTTGNVSLKDSTIKETTSTAYANLTYNLENERHHFLQQKRKLSEYRLIPNAFHSVPDNSNANVKMTETQLTENASSNKTHTIDENNSASIDLLNTMSPKFSKLKKQTQMLRRNTFNTDLVNNFQNEYDQTINNGNSTNAEDLRMHYKHNDEMRQEINMLPSGVHIDVDNMIRPSNLKNIYNSITKTTMNSKMNAISQSASGTYKSEPSIIEENETTADVLIDIVENSRKNPPKVATSINSTTSANIESSKALEKSCFEDVENKLEEMFAGIDDEPILRQKLTHDDGAPSVSSNTSTTYNDIEAARSSSMMDDSSKLLTHMYRGTKTSSVLISNQKDNKDKQLTVEEDSLKTKASKKSMENDDVNVFHNVIVQNEQTERSSDLYSPSPQAQTKTNINSSNVYANAKTNEVINSSECTNVLAATSHDNDVKKEAKATASRRKCIKSNTSKINCPKKIHGVKPNPFHINLKILDQSRTGLRTRRLTLRKSFNCDEGDGIYQQQQQNYNNEKLPRDFEVKHRSPFIAIKKDGSITIVNTTTATEDVNEKNAKIKKTTSYTQGHRNVRGLYSSTLGNNYDAFTADSSWICVFCKLGPHKMGLGDLFGPYIATVNCGEYVNAINSVSNKSDSNTEFNCKHNQAHKMNAKVRDCSLMLPTNSNNYYYPPNETEIKRRKRATSASFSHHDNIDAMRTINMDNASPDVFLGMCKTSDGNYEIWLHEDCAIWTPDVLLIGSQLVGITNAVWNSLSKLCVSCNKPGAMVCCLQRNCKQMAHLPCARQAQWLFDETTFWVFCQKHSTKRHTNSTLVNPLTT